jgi:hypothetical protein
LDGLGAEGGLLAHRPAACRVSACSRRWRACRATVLRGAVRTWLAAWCAAMSAGVMAGVVG